MKVGTKIKIRHQYYSDIYELKEGDFVIEFDQYPGFPGYYAEFNGKYFECIDTVDKDNPVARGNQGEIRGIDLLKTSHEIIE